MNELCMNCYKTRKQHIGDKCPGLDLHVVIDAESVTRAAKTGHPRLLYNVLRGQTNGVLSGVSITAISVTE